VGQAFGEMAVACQFIRIGPGHRDVRRADLRDPPVVGLGVIDEIAVQFAQILLASKRVRTLANFADACDDDSKARKAIPAATNTSMRRQPDQARSGSDRDRIRVFWPEGLMPGSAGGIPCATTNSAVGQGLPGQVLPEAVPIRRTDSRGRSTRPGERHLRRIGRVILQMRFDSRPLRRRQRC